MAADPVRVAVLGGGPAAVTTAFRLSDPALENRFAVTIHQPGWRLGGKCASGRNLAPGRGARIEEHGLHVWFGFYDNAFTVMREVYDELGRPAGHPLRTLEDAFKGCDEIVLYDRQEKGWIDLAFKAPANDQKPGSAHPLPGFWDIANWMCEWALHRYREVRAGHPAAFTSVPGSGPRESHWDLLAVAAHAAGRALEPGEHLLVHARELARIAQSAGTEHLPRALTAKAPSFLAAFGRHPERVLVDILCHFRDWLWDAVVEGQAAQAPHLRLFFSMFDTFVSATAGIVRDGVLEEGWEAINHYDLCEWLGLNGAKVLTLGATPAERSPVLRSIYDVAFGYPGGKIANANVAAGTAMSDFLRLTFAYRGSLMYKMQAGMGDTVLAPFYLALRERGVKFEFFSSVTGLRLDAAGKLVDSIEVVRQVDMRDRKANPSYQPLHTVKGLECWPSEPLWDQLADGEELSGRGLDFEQEPNPLGRDPRTLRRGTDFDEVVLAIPVGALGAICGDVAKRVPRFAKMLDNSVTVQTQAFQLWLSKKPTELGYGHSENSVAGSYTEPLDTWCDMTHLLGREEWADGDQVRGLAYFCGVLEERAGETPAEARKRARKNAERFLASEMGPIWPGAVGKGAGLDWSLLADPSRAAGTARLDSQYWRANVTPSERYVLTPAGSLQHRLRADESGVENLVLAGDWTRNGIDGGCVEAAVTSGLQAARALIGSGQQLPGENGEWLSERHTGVLSRPSLSRGTLSPPPPAGSHRPPATPPGQGPAYVEYGGRATAPPPFLSTGGRFKGLLLEGDAGLIADLIDRMFNVPAAGRAHYQPLFGGHVLLQTGAFAKVSSQAPGFDRWGYVEEAQISLWIPLAAGRLDGRVFLAERVCLAVPFILVNNPMSYAGGREDYGYPKSLGVFDPADGLRDGLTVDAFGGRFTPTSRADWHRLFTIHRGPLISRPAKAPKKASPTAPPKAAKARRGPWHELADLAHRVAEIPGEHLPMLPEPSVLSDVLAALTGKQTRQVFLKQFRDVRANDAAIYQKVVEAPIHFLSTSVRPSLEEWTVEIEQLDSHPIERELGVHSQTTRLTFDVKMDMIAEPGTVIAP